jgi:hypothetical protein
MTTAALLRRLERIESADDGRFTIVRLHTDADGNPITQDGEPYRQEPTDIVLSRCYADQAAA